jgi:predicted Zn-dependent protease with MMP-like domain
MSQNKENPLLDNVKEEVSGLKQPEKKILTQKFETFDLETEEGLEKAREVLEETLDVGFSKLKVFAKNEIRGIIDIVDDTEKSSNDNFTLFNETLNRLIQKEQSEALKQVNVEVFSDEKLEQNDIDFIVNVKKDLDSIDGKNKKIKIVIANENHWSDITKSLGMESHSEFTGSSQENPIVPDGVSQFVILPSKAVFEKDTMYKKAYSQSNQMKELIDKNSQETYKNVYLRNVLAHEISHLYQFGNEEIQTILNSSRETQTDGSNEYDKKYNEFMDLREFLACAYGYYQMEQNCNTEYQNAFLEASSIAANNQQESKIKKLFKFKLLGSKFTKSYQEEQAKRQEKSKELLDNFENKNDMKEFFRKIHIITQKNNDSKYQLQDIVKKYIDGDIKVGDFIGSVNYFLNN